MYHPFEGGVYRSTDGGNTWQRMTQSFNWAMYKIAISPNYAADGTLLAYTYGHDGDYFRAVFRSTDRGASWTKLKSGTYAEMPQPETLLPAVPQPDLRFRLEKRAVLRTTDGGQTWTQVKWADTAQGLLLSPNLATDHTIYLILEDGILRSQDDGNTWGRWINQRLEGAVEQSKLSAWTITPLLKDGSYQLLIGTDKGEFWMLDPAVMVWEPDLRAAAWPTILAGESVDEIKPAPDGSVWLNLGTSLVHWRAGKIEARFVVSTEVPIKWAVESIAVAADGTLWAGGTGPTIARFDGQTWTQYDLSRMAKYDHSIGAVYTSPGPDGGVWVSQEYDELFHWNGRTWEVVDGPSHSVEHVMPLAIDRKGVLWGGVYDGLSRYENGTWTSQAKGGGITQLQFGPNDLLYVRSGGRSDDQRSRFWKFEAGNLTYLPERVDCGLFFASPGFCWARGNSPVWWDFTTRDGLPSNHVSAVAEDANGRLWFGTANGAAYVDPRTIGLIKVDWK